MRLRELRRRCRETLILAGAARPEYSADLIISRRLGIGRAELLYKDDEIPAQSCEGIFAAAARRAQGVPLAYVLHEAEFYGYRFKVGRGVLIPRPETELLVEAALEYFPRGRGARFADWCTGSGCIAVTLARLIPGARVTAVDISEKALSIARENARRLDAEVDFRQGDALGELFPGQREQFDLIVSNPPYIPRREKASMRVNVTGYEPAEALFVEDDDPLIFYRAIARNARRLLRPGGRLYFEIHENFADETLRMLTREGFPDTAVRRDLNDKNRMTCSLQRR